MKLLRKMVAAVCVLSLPSLPATVHAQNAPAATTQSPITLSSDVMAVKEVTDENGVSRTELVTPELIVPGDRLIMGNSYANEGAEAVTDFVVTNAVPPQVRLSADADAALTVSVDGGASWGTLETLSVTAEDGASRAATHADVTHVRWTLASIAPGERGRLEYPAIIR